MFYKVKMHETCAEEFVSCPNLLSLLTCLLFHFAVVATTATKEHFVSAIVGFSGGKTPIPEVPPATHCERNFSMLQVAHCASYLGGNNK